jgi:hypothetical protein
VWGVGEKDWVRVLGGGGTDEGTVDKKFEYCCLMLRILR